MERMDELGRRVGMLRLLLADLNARREQTEVIQAQLRSQIERIVEFTVRSNAIVSNALTTMAERDEHLKRAEADLRHIEMLRRRAQDELDALLVTRGIADARARLDELERRAAELRSAPGAVGDAASVASGELAEIAAEMAELRSTIDSASGAAARHLTERTERRAQREQ
jgi:chromosome segregation ATPase